MGCDCGANAAPGLFSVQPGGPRRRGGPVGVGGLGELEAIGPSFRVARSGKTAEGAEGNGGGGRVGEHAGIATSLAP